MLSWHQTKPSSDLPTTAEVLRIADRCDQRAGRDRPDAGNLGQLAAEVNAEVPCLDLRFKFIDLAVQILEVLEKPLHHQSKPARKLIGTVFHQLGNARGNVANALRNDETERPEQSTYLVCLRRACPHKPLPHPMPKNAAIWSRRSCFFKTTLPRSSMP